MNNIVTHYMTDIVYDLSPTKYNYTTNYFDGYYIYLILSIWKLYKVCRKV